MGPALNPFFWLVCFATVCVSLIASAIIGAIAYAGTAAILGRRSTHTEPIVPWMVAGALSLTVFVLVLRALSNVPFGAPHTPTTMPSTDDIVGTWQPISGWLELLTEEGYEASTPALVLSRDGAIEMTNMPDRWFDPLVESPGDFYSGRGQWEIGRGINNAWVLSVEIQFQENGTQRQINRSLGLLGNKPPYNIYFYWGDPDSGRMFQFERVQEPP